MQAVNSKGINQFNCCINMKRTLILVYFSLVYFYSAYSQKIEIQSGNPKLFKSVRNYYLTFDYTDLQVGTYGPEKAYIDYMMDDAEKRKKGSSSEWLTQWQADRTIWYQPRFIELFNDNLGYQGIKIDTSSNGQTFQLNVHTYFIEPGFNRNAKRAPALLNVIVTLSEIDKPENALVISMNDIPGNEILGSYLPDNRRIGEAYAKCGKELGRYLLKVIY